MRDSFSRRDFLKVSGAGLLGLFLMDLRLERVLAVAIPKQGRVTISGTELLREPSFAADKLSAFGLDQVVEITGAV